MLKLEQKKGSSHGSSANYPDVYAMNKLSSSGSSAFKHNFPNNAKPSGGKLTTSAEFYVWTSLPLGSFQLMSGAQKYKDTSITTSITVKKENQKKVAAMIMDVSNTYTLPYPGNFTLEWETPCYNTEGEIIPTPSYVQDSSAVSVQNTCFANDEEQQKNVSFGTLKFSATFFGVGRLTFDSPVYTGTYTVTVPNTKEGKSRLKKIEKGQDIGSMIVGQHKSGSKIAETFLSLTFPESNVDECEDGTPKSGSCSKVGRSITHVDIYYSTCTGEVIDKIYTIKDSCDEEEE